ncbi:hypothetical protein IVG45_11660 [Methylomonas sp. LL1]|uniref:hypothetical protein n=1 Tax=Methylomonas sp. LL1 TaxID=2785785 RepID=UPI0018C447DF|nr:hypothetical protein [Methylomonas sp. LL1]QPK61556.1 hypothetical protein IVG45_11660 [Methylomonas sp. LL1]
MLLKVLSILSLASLSLPSLASPVYNASNGHYYELHTFTDDWRLDWSEAKNFAESLSHQGGSGYLATVTSQAEDDFLWSVLGAQGSFLGGFDTSSYNSTDGKWKHQAWQWVSGEAFSYTNFLQGEPNHWQDNSALTPDPEDYLMYWWQAGAGNERWNDTNLDSSHLTSEGIRYVVRGFVVEFNPTLTTPVPVPPSIWLFGSGLMLLLQRRKAAA